MTQHDSLKVNARKVATSRSLSLGAYLFAGVFLFRLLALFRFTESQLFLPQGGDMHFYNEWALRIAKGALTDHFAFYGLPLYAYMLAGIYKVCGYSPFVPGLLQAALDAGTAALLFRLGSMCFAASAPAGEEPNSINPTFGKNFIGLMAAVGWTFFQPAQAYSVILMPTAWLVFVFWFVVWQTVKRKQLPRWWQVLFLGMLLGLCAMGVATILLLAPLVVAAIFSRWHGANGKRILAVALLFSGIVMGTSPAWMHNYFVAHDRVFLSAHSGINFWVGNNPVANGYPKFPPELRVSQRAMLEDSIKVAEKAESRPLKRSEVSAYWSAKATNWIENHPLLWLRLLAQKFVNFWYAFQYDDLSVISILRENRIIFPGIGFGLVAALSIPGMLLACWTSRNARWLAAAVLLHLFALLPVFITERYRLAAVPGLLLFAAFTLYKLWQKIAAARAIEALTFSLALVASTAFISLPQKDPALWAVDSYNSGLLEMEAGHLDRAQQKLDRAYQYCPRNAEANFAEGNLNLKLGRPSRARAFYLSTLALDSNHQRALNNLGVLALNDKDWSGATNYFSRALAVGPDNGKTHYLIARAELAQGQVQPAAAEVARALALEPGQPLFQELQGEIEKHSVEGSH